MTSSLLVHVSTFFAVCVCVLAGRCPQNAAALSLVTYSIDPNTWGFSLSVPMFSNLNTIFISCDARFCDTQVETMDCDR